MPNMRFPNPILRMHNPPLNIKTALGNPAQALPGSPKKPTEVRANKFGQRESCSPDRNNGRAVTELYTLPKRAGPSGFRLADRNCAFSKNCNRYHYSFIPGRAPDGT
jgi:hypothetical protein